MFDFLIESKRRPDTAKPLSNKAQYQHHSELYLIRATVSDWEGRVRSYPYREFALRGDQTLDHLASAILDYFDFGHDHLYGFYNNIKSWTSSSEAYNLCIEGGNYERCTHEIIVAQVFNYPKKKMLFLFDFGDEWHFVVQLKAIKEGEKDQKYPVLLKSVGEAPEQYPPYDEEGDF
ncbi:MAG TPA: hypothetical protein EYP59_06380 [Thiotrichaceae bacterium]|nr:hypothetical protein [Thiotrichaceae bacterium]